MSELYLLGKYKLGETKMSEKWQLTQLVDSPECCYKCKYQIKDKVCPDLEKCHQIEYDHECYPLRERYLMFESKLGVK